MINNKLDILASNIQKCLVMFVVIMECNAAGVQNVIFLTYSRPGWEPPLLGMGIKYRVSQKNNPLFLNCLAKTTLKVTS